MRFLSDTSRNLAAAIALFVAVLSLCAGGNSPNEDQAPLTAAAEALPTPEHARVLYDGRPQLAQAEVVRTDHPNNAVAQVHSRITQAQGEALSGVTVVRFRQTQCEGGRCYSRPRLFRGR